MAYLSFPSVCFSGIAACVPKEIEYNSQSELLSEKERDNIIASTGISEKRVAPDGVCTSDLCFSAAEKLIKELKWDKSEIQALVFVSQTPDYILPATACVLQDRLGLPSECLSYDVSLGCSGWVYGLMNIASLVSTGYIKKALMLCGDLTTRTQSYRDKHPILCSVMLARVPLLNTTQKPLALNFTSLLMVVGKMLLLYPLEGIEILLQKKA